jgi:very-short-patch-repair endonuclease
VVGLNQSNTIACVCFFCRKDFHKPVGEYNRTIREGQDRHFCSGSCAAKEGNASRKSKPLVKVCKYCGKDFNTTTHSKAAKFFCSRGCASSGSMTPHRIKRAVEMGTALPHDVHTIAASLRSKEGWKYQGVLKHLDDCQVKYFVEHPIGNYIFDLALPGLKTLVEFDGDYHKYTDQAKTDRKKTAVAWKHGWVVARVRQISGEAVKLSDFLEDMGKLGVHFVC